MDKTITTGSMSGITTIHQTLLLLGLISIFTAVIITIFYNKNIVGFLKGFFTIAFWFMLVFFLFQISMEIFTKNGSFKTSESGKISSAGHFEKGYDVPVNIHLYISPQKKEFTYKSDSTSNSSGMTFSRFTNPKDNLFKDSMYASFDKKMLQISGLTQKKLDSFFENSSDIKITGNKILIGYPFEENKFLKTNTSSFSTKGTLNIKSTNSFFAFCQFLKSYIPFLISLLIIYQLKSIFKLLKKDFGFSLQLSKRIKKTGFLLIIGQIITLFLSLIFTFYYGFASFKNWNQNNGIQLTINPRLEFDIVLTLVGLSLLILGVLLKKGNEIQQENDLTI